uniref:EGF-like domain-containing protein n=1 Tax=Mola mola TaxID=94237 RepID=A0A3Q3WC93_MOLML
MLSQTFQTLVLLCPAASPTVPPLHSEHFKPCHERDLTYCLNGGECFVIETLSGPHKHCKCREGYQGIRCDQFLPKTDSILSDPNHLGIEFMESKEVYKRQVLSTTSIAMAISLLGTLCMALYCRKKLQAHLKESRSLKNYSANSHNAQDVKMRAPNINLRMHEVTIAGFTFCSFTCSQCCCLHNLDMTLVVILTNHNFILRSGSLSNIPDQRIRTAHWSAPRRTPPITGGRLNPIGGSKFSGPAYQHLQEVDSSEQEADTPSFTGNLLCPCPGRPGVAERAQACALYSIRTLPPGASCSIPIIPSVQCRGDNEVSCMQTSVGPATSATCKEEKRRKLGHAALSASSCSSAVGQPQDEVALLLEEAQEQLRALVLAHRRQEEGGASSCTARETVCFLNRNGSAGAMSCNGPTQTQLLSPSLSHRDLGRSGQ